MKIKADKEGLNVSYMFIYKDGTINENGSKVKIYIFFLAYRYKPLYGTYDGSFFYYFPIKNIVHIRCFYIYDTYYCAENPSLTNFKVLFKPFVNEKGEKERRSQKKPALFQ